MAWSKIYDTFHDHPKFYRIARRLDVPREYFDAYIHGTFAKLWSWCLRHAPDGNLTNLQHEDIEWAVGWRGESGKWLEAAIDIGLLDEVGDQLLIHDFDESAGSLRRARQKAEERERKRQSQTCRATVADSRKGEEKRGEEKSKTTVPLRDTDGQGKGWTKAKSSAFATYQKYHPRSILGDKEARLVKTRYTEGIKTSSHDEIVSLFLKAIRGVHTIPYNCGQNERKKKYQSFELTFRSWDHINKYAEGADEFIGGNGKKLKEFSWEHAAREARVMHDAKKLAEWKKEHGYI